VKYLLHIIAILLCCVPLHGQIDPYRKNILTTNFLTLGTNLYFTNGVLEASASPVILPLTVVNGGTGNDLSGGLSGVIPYFDFASGRFVTTGSAYTNGLVFESTLGFLSVFRTNITGDIMLNLQEGGASAPSIQGYSDKFVVANTNLTFDAVGPYSIRLRINGSNVLEAVAGSISLSGQTNLVADNGSALTYNGVAVGGAVTNSAILQTLYYGGQYGFATSSLIPTNIRSSNLPSGSNDLFTVPVGQRFIPSSIILSTTNTTGSVVYQLVKTNGAYYRFGTDTSANVQTNFSQGVSFSGDNFCFEAGETVGINTTVKGINATIYGILFSTNLPIYSPRLMSLSVGNNTFYTCPAGKCALAPTLPHTSIGNQTLFSRYINASGGNRIIAFYIVPSGGSPGSSNVIVSGKTIADKAAFTQSSGILFPGDSLVLATDAVTAVQWVSTTVVEIPFP